MERNNNGTRFKDYCLWEKRLYTPYDYEREGLLKHIMSPVILDAKSTPVKTLLQYMESSLVFVMKYVDVLKNFKNIHWKNR